MIKFRAKRKDNGEEIKGFLFVCSGDNIPYILEANCCACEMCNRGCEPPIIFAGWVEVIPETIAMYTTINDKNKVEIYGSIEIDDKMTKGGDIITLTHWFVLGYPDYPKRWLTNKPEKVILPKFYQYMFEDEETPKGEKNKYEVIGNQTDNPELLEAAQ